MSASTFDRTTCNCDGGWPPRGSWIPHRRECPRFRAPPELDGRCTCDPYLGGADRKTDPMAHHSECDYRIGCLNPSPARGCKQCRHYEDLLACAMESLAKAAIR